MTAISYLLNVSATKMYSAMTVACLVLREFHVVLVLMAMLLNDSVYTVITRPSDSLSRQLYAT